MRHPVTVVSGGLNGLLVFSSRVPSFFWLKLQRVNVKWVQVSKRRLSLILMLAKTRPTTTTTA